MTTPGRKPKRRHGAPARLAQAIASPRGRRLRATVGLTLGLGLIAAALVIVAQRWPEVAQAWSHAAEAPRWLIAAALLLPLANWLIISFSFYLLTRRFGQVAPGEMAALIGGAWLLNFLPMRPGMFGRVAYHKLVNGIPVKASARVLFEAVALTGIALIPLLVIFALLAWPLAQASPATGWTLLALATAPLLLAGAGARLAHSEKLALFVISAAARYLDCVVWVARYAALFALIGEPVGLVTAIAVAAASQIVLLVPIVGNGLGLRESAVYLLAPIAARVDPQAAAAFASDADTIGSGVALSADLVNRAAELLIAVPVGLISLAVIARRLRKRGITKKQLAAAQAQAQSPTQPTTQPNTHNQPTNEKPQTPPPAGR